MVAYEVGRSVWVVVFRRQVFDREASYAEPDGPLGWVHSVEAFELKLVSGAWFSCTGLCVESGSVLGQCGGEVAESSAGVPQWRTLRVEWACALSESAQVRCKPAQGVEELRVGPEAGKMDVLVWLESRQ